MNTWVIIADESTATIFNTNRYEYELKKNKTFILGKTNVADGNSIDSLRNIVSFISQQKRQGAYKKLIIIAPKSIANSLTSLLDEEKNVAKTSEVITTELE